MNLQKIVDGAICRYKDVRLVEVDGGVRVYRKFVRNEDLISFAKSNLLQALEALSTVEGRQKITQLSSRGGHEADSLRAVAMYLRGGQAGINEDYISFAMDKIKQSYALMVYMGIVGEDEKVNTFSNYLLK